ncbi:hypothetical protein K7432_012912 [Basidiobolus ranarum]|uniref:Uncharacterized protein n=1 Tax=Basidiobolus ranarum TaxID=34480 RepID=A0ABR2VRL0_9FUNG
MIKLLPIKAIRNICSFRDETVSRREQVSNLANSLGLCSSLRRNTGVEGDIIRIHKSPYKVHRQKCEVMPKFDDMLDNDKTFRMSLTPTVAQ